MPFDIKKTILVGLGGTGRDAVLYAKRMLTKVYGKQIPSAIKFLVFDTTASKSLDEDIKLDPTEFNYLKVTNVENVLKFRNHIRKWFPERTPSRAILDGAGQVRALGRLALHANFSEIKKSIESAIKDVNDYAALRQSEFNVIGEDTSVIIVTSTSGGTGSGSYLEIAWIFRSLLDSNKDKITAYILLPDIFRQLPATDNVRPNCYGALKELDYFMNFFKAGKEFKIDFGEEIIDIKTQPFNLIYFVNNKNKKGVEYSEIADLTEFLGTGLFLSTSALAKESGDVWDNLRNAIAGKKGIKGKVPFYSSFGISEVVYEGEKLQRLYISETASRLLNAYYSSSTLDCSQEVQDFIERTNIREDKDQDHIIDKIIQVSTKVMQLPEIKKGASKRISDIHTIYINRIENDTETITTKNLDELLTDKINILNDFIKSNLKIQGGVDFCVKFCNNLVGITEAFKDMMISERDQYIINQNRIVAKYPSLLEDIVNGEKKFMGSQKAIEEACLAYQVNAKNEAVTLIEIKRREKAIIFFANYIDCIKKWQNNINEIINQVKGLIQSYAGELQQIRARKKGIKPFIIHLEDALIDKIDIGVVDLSDFIKFVDRENFSIELWFQFRTSEIRGTIEKYCLQKPNAKALKETTIEKELEKLSETEKLKLIQQLDQMAIPLWQYDQGVVASTEMIYLFGVPNKNQTLMLDDKIVSTLEGRKYKPSIVSTNDPNRIIFFKIEASAPAFAVQRIADYKREYDEPDAPFDYHIDKSWEDMLPDLFPDNDDEEGKKYWALGFVPEFDLIVKTGRTYKIKSLNQGAEIDDNWIKMPILTRKASMMEFLQNEELVQEVKEEVEQKVKNLGFDTAKSAIEKHIQDVKEKSKTSSDETKKQVESEIKLLREYLEQFNSI